MRPRGTLEEAAERISGRGKLSLMSTATRPPLEKRRTGTEEKGDVHGAPAGVLPPLQTKTKTALRGLEKFIRETT